MRICVIFVATVATRCKSLKLSKLSWNKGWNKLALWHTKLGEAPLFVAHLTQI